MNRIGKRIFVFLTAVLLLMSLVSLPVLAADTADVERIYGENRCLTAIEVSQFAYPDGADTVIIVTANNFPDALAGSVLAHHLGAPILLVRDNDSDMTAVLAEMERLGVETAYILGGDKAVSDALEAKIETKASVERLAGESRYETAQLIADMVGMPEDGHVFLVSGTNFPDALAIAPVAARRGIPILLTDPDYLRDDVLTAFDELDVKSVTIIGGPKAIPEELAALLEEKGLEIEERIYGDSREDTAVAIAIAFFTEPGSVIVANGREGYPDALVGGYLGALLNARLLLVKKDEVKDSTTTYLEDNNIGDVKVLGGDKVISDEVEEALGEIEGGEETPGGGGPVVPTDPDAADKSAAKAVIKPSWAVKNVEKVDELPFDTTETDSSLFEVTITTSYADIKAASESGRSVTTFFTVPEGVTVWYPVWDGSTQTYESTADETGPFAMGMVGHPLSAGNIEADGAVFVTLGETSETEFAFTIKLVDAAPGWGNVVYATQDLTIRRSAYAFNVDDQLSIPSINEWTSGKKIPITNDDGTLNAPGDASYVALKTALFGEATEDVGLDDYKIEASLTATAEGDFGYTNRSVMIKELDVAYEGANEGGGDLKVYLYAHQDSAWFDLVESVWGNMPDGRGFNLYKDENTSLEAYAFATVAGKYTITFEAIDIDNGNATICEGTATIKVGVQDDSE